MDPERIRRLEMFTAAVAQSNILFPEQIVDLAVAIENAFDLRLQAMREQSKQVHAEPPTTDPFNVEF